MRTIIFQNERERYEESSGIFKFKGPGIIAPFELLWTTLDNTPASTLRKKDYLTLRKVKNKLRLISGFKDLDQDSRILAANGPHKLQLEDAEYDLLVKLMELAQFNTTKISDTVAELWDLIDTAGSD